MRLIYYRLGSLLLSLVFIAGVILLAGASPIAVVASMWKGAFGSADQLARVVATLAPLLLCASGLVFTFTAGLYNLGIEGQIAFGAIATMVVVQPLQNAPLPPGLIIILALGGGIIGGALWGLVCGLLNVYGKVNEIFAGLGLNFVAQGLALYLVFGPWQRPGVASMSGTELINQSLWLAKIGNTEASPIALALGIAAVMITAIAVRGTYFGLKLKAVGNNLRAAHVLGIPAIRQLLLAFMICGAMAGLAGSLQVLAVFHRFLPGISSNLGFLALLVIMLVNYEPLLILPIAFLFSALNIGSLQLPLSLDLESSLSGVIQGSLLLFALLGQGLADRFPGTKTPRSIDSPDSSNRSEPIAEPNS
ncbi:nucleoside ABC transporter membrane protein [Thalassoporum mexicanum PCC 7367]|uniref:ABC transporter permease n=1 Tax=Thalassoporum mexicanum TaxID=3457544 RepID=UPI00029F8626|nr:ABC transporter permease [Pseudanabaena sp. PCC 7367]AFY69856.1 nucleoside ABC transporter membrane protein [Pseudanabaena sp. PCC 7367]